MVRVYRAPNLTMLEIVRTALANEGIRTMIRNEYTSIAAGAVPMADAMPELWLINDRDLERAQAIIEQGSRPESN